MIWLLTVGALGIVRLSRRVLDEVKRPTEKLLRKDIDKVEERCIFKHFREPFAECLLLLLGFAGRLVLGSRDDAGILLSGFADGGEDLFFLLCISLDSVGRLEWQKALLGPRPGNKHLIARQVTRSGMMPCVGDAPGVVRNEEGRVEDPTDGIVERLGGAECLVAAFVRDDPDARED